MGQTTKEFSAKIARLTMYIGYGLEGAVKIQRIRTLAKKLNTTPSKLIAETLKKKYPSLGL